MLHTMTVWQVKQTKQAMQHLPPPEGVRTGETNELRELLDLAGIPPPHYVNDTEQQHVRSDPVTKTDVLVVIRPPLTDQGAPRPIQIINT